ncbi:MAG: radical SAM protein [Alphaproteobacteria bacterium]
MTDENDRPSAAFEVRHRRTARLPSSPAALERLRQVPLVRVPSRFNVAVDLGNGLKAVYNTFSAALAVVPQDLWQRFLAPGGRFSCAIDAVPRPLADLEGRGFFVAEGVDELDLVRAHYNGGRHDRGRKITANILPTLGCNLSCSYCFEGQLQVERHSRAMTRETEEAMVTFLAARVKGSRGLTVSWFGGEPLLSVAAIERLSPRLHKLCEDAEIPYGAVLTTNGVLLREDTVATLVRSRVSVLQVTVDVPNATKRDKKGRDTQETVLDNLVAAAAAAAVHLRINLTRDAPDEWDDLFDGLVRRGLHKTLKSVNIANVYQPEHARADGVRSDVAHRTYVDVVRRQRHRARALGLPMHTSLSWQKPGGCAATAETAFTIDPDGFLFKCPEDAGWPERAFGSVFVDGPTNQANSLFWLTYDWFRHEQCRDCAVLPQCAGGCPHRRLFQPDLDRDDFCYWFLRGDLEGRILELATSLMFGGADADGSSAVEGCGT